MQAVLEELQPDAAQEEAGALNIAGLHVRRGRFVELEAMVLSHATRTPMLPPTGFRATVQGGQEDLTKSAPVALSSDLFDRPPRYERHLSES